LTAAQVLNNYMADAPNYAAPTVKLVSPASAQIVFPTVAPAAGATAPKTVEIQNIGLTSLVFSGTGFALTGANADQFALVTPVDTTDVAAGTTRTVQVVFDPTSTGVKTATLAITTNATNATVEVTLLGYGARRRIGGGHRSADFDRRSRTAARNPQFVDEHGVAGRHIHRSHRAADRFGCGWCPRSRVQPDLDAFQFPDDGRFYGRQRLVARGLVYDESVPDEAQVVTWSNRGEENQNGAFLYGTNATWGAFAGWAAGDSGYLNGAAPAAGEWHHVGITYQGVDNGGLLSVYVDGLLNNSKTMTLNIHGPGDSQAMPVMLGGSTGNDPLGLDAVVSGWWYTGWLASVRIHDGTLTADQVLQNFLVSQPSRLASAPTGLDLADADDTGVSATDNITKNTTGLTISGTATAETTVKIKEGATVLVSGTAAEFAAGLDIALTEGSHTITATSTDAENVESDVSDPLTIVVDATAPSVVLVTTAPDALTTVRSGDGYLQRNGVGF
jgi:hypothetical protein